jgi:hypothetical protein
MRLAINSELWVVSCLHLSFYLRLENSEKCLCYDTKHLSVGKAVVTKEIVGRGRHAKCYLV